MSNTPFNPEYQTNNIEGKIITALERISESFRVLLWNESKQHGLSPIQVQILIFLSFHEDEKRKVSYLADEFNMTKATVSDTIKTLEKKGLILKEYAPNDTRSYFINLTSKGQKTSNQIANFTQELQHPISKLDDQAQKDMLQYLLGIIKHLNKANIITVQRMCFSCSYYQKKENQHFCKLLNQQLQSSDIRVDCPEHQQQIGVVNLKN